MNAGDSDMVGKWGCNICYNDIFSEDTSEEVVNKALSGEGNGRWYEWVFPANFLDMPANKLYQHTCRKLYHAGCMAKWMKEANGDKNCPNCKKPVIEIFSHKLLHDAVIQKIRQVVLIIFALAAGMIGNQLFAGNGLGVVASMALGYYLTSQAMKEPPVQIILHPAKVIFDYVYCRFHGIEKTDIQEIGV